MAGEDKRVRAWVLVKSKEPEETAKELDGELKAELSKPHGNRRTNFIFVRADVVDVVEGEGEYNVIVPVDAANPGSLKQALTMIKNARGTSSVTVCEVKEHYPDPPYSTATFVTQNEWDVEQPQEFAPAGLHPHSPGRNAWG